MSLFRFGRDIQGYNAFAPRTADVKLSAAITASGNASIIVPSNFTNWIAVFSYQTASEFWVAFNATAAVPAGPTFASTTSELTPNQRSVSKGDVINLLNPGSATASVQISLYAVS